MTTIRQQADALAETITATLGSIASAVTNDPDKARPTPGHVAVLIESPRLTWPDWSGTATAEWTICVIAGTATTQAESVELLWSAMDALGAAGVNLDSGTPVSYNLAGLGNLAAYEVTLNALDTNE